MRHGFTLIEISIVIVIIGLIIGGVMMGRDLVKAAEIKQQIGQVEKINTAIHAFRSKYSALPGDIMASEAAAFGFAARSGARGHGDGNRILEACTPGNPAIYIAFPIGCETVLFWRDLSEANMLDGTFIGTDTDMNTTSLAQTRLYMPATRLDEGVMLATADALNRNALVGMMHYTAVTGPAFKTYNAFAIDSKMDDGNSVTGTVTAVEGANSAPGRFTAPTNFVWCANATGQYALSTTSSFNFCSLRFPMAAN